MPRYRFQICKQDGSTPLGSTPSVEFEGADQYEARSRLHQSLPGHEIVSAGLADEIDEHERKWK